MTDSSDDIDPSARDQREIGRKMVDDSTGLGSVIAHTYRGEMDRVTTWRQRMDQATTWAVTVLAAILTWAFSSPDNPHYILLGGVVIVTIFLFIEARRYRDYDVFRSRIRTIQKNLFSDALDPTQGVEDRDWRVHLSEAFRHPTVTVPLTEALANRLRRVYLWLLGVLLVAWIFRITAFEGEGNLLSTAAIGQIPGTAVVVVVAGFFLALVAIAYWPRERQAREEFDEADPEE